MSREEAFMEIKFFGWLSFFFGAASGFCVFLATGSVSYGFAALFGIQSLRYAIERAALLIMRYE
jgi:hypothetical protein